MTDTNLGRILEKLKKETLKKILNTIEQKPEKEKEDMIDQIVDFGFDKGVKDFVKALDTKYIIKGLEETIKNIDKKEKREKLKDKFFDKIEQDGLEEFLKKMKIETLNIYVKSLKFQTNADTIEELSKDINDEVIYIGSRFILSKISIDLLNEISISLKLKKLKKKLNLIDSILKTEFKGIESIEEEEEEEEECEDDDEEEKEDTNEANEEEKEIDNDEKMNTITTTSSSTGSDVKENKYFGKTREEMKKIRPKLEVGISKADIQDCYWADELKEFCKENGLGMKGSKPDNIRKIMNHFEKKRKQSSSSSSLNTSNKKKKKIKFISFSFSSLFKRK